MKRISSRLVKCFAMSLLLAGSNMAMAADATKPKPMPVMDGASSDDKGTFCLDSMETVPFSDELDPIPVSTDNCDVPQGTIHT